MCYFLQFIFFNWCDTDTYSCVHLPFGLTWRWLDRGNGWLAMRRGGKAPVYHLLLLVSDNQDRDFQWLNSYLQFECLCGICFIAKQFSDMRKKGHYEVFLIITSTSAPTPVAFLIKFLRADSGFICHKPIQIGT